MARYKDMRRETGFEILSMWFNLGNFFTILLLLWNFFYHYLKMPT